MREKDDSLQAWRSGLKVFSVDDYGSNAYLFTWVRILVERSFI